MSESNGNSAAVARQLDTVIALLRELVAVQRQRPARLLRLSAAADYIAVSTWQLRRLIHAGEIPAVKVHADDPHAPVLVDVADLDEFVERRKQ